MPFETLLLTRLLFFHDPFGLVENNFRCDFRMWVLPIFPFINALMAFNPPTLFCLFCFCSNSGIRNSAERHLCHLNHFCWLDYSFFMIHLDLCKITFAAISACECFQFSHFLTLWWHSIHPPHFAYFAFVVAQLQRTNVWFFMYVNVQEVNYKISPTGCTDISVFPCFVWCCCYYFVRNSLVALLEALFACCHIVLYVYACRQSASKQTRTDFLPGHFASCVGGPFDTHPSMQFRHLRFHQCCNCVSILWTSQAHPVAC